MNVLDTCRACFDPRFHLVLTLLLFMNSFKNFLFYFHFFSEYSIFFFLVLFVVIHNDFDIAGTLTFNNSVNLLLGMIVGIIDAIIMLHVHGFFFLFISRNHSFVVFFFAVGIVVFILVVIFGKSCIVRRCRVTASGDRKKKGRR